MRILKFFQRQRSTVIAGCLLAFVAFSFGAVPSALAEGEGLQASGQPTTTTASTKVDSSKKVEVPDTLTSIATSLANFAQGFGETILKIVANILSKIVELVAGLISLVITLCGVILEYGRNGEFATQQQVINGWKIVRDLINSFFIVVLIAIALSTIIRFQVYNFRSTLPRLILAAFLVNFSRTICLLGINFATSVMLTFVDGVKALLPAYALGLRLPALVAFKSSSLNNLYGDIVENRPKTGLATATDFVPTILSLILAIVLIMLALGGIVTFMLILLFRIITLWFLIILSPLAFFLWGVPGRASGYWGQWLDEFVKHVIVGPIAAFFLYLIIYFYVYNIRGLYGFKAVGTINKVPQLTLTLASNPEILLGYVISLGLMFVSFEIIQQLGVRGGDIAAKYGVEGIGVGGLRKMWGGVKGAAAFADDWVGSKTGYSVQQLGRGVEGISHGLAERRAGWVKKQRQILAERQEAAEKGGSPASAILWAAYGGDSEFFENNGIPQLARRVAVGVARTGLGAVQRGAGAVSGTVSGIKNASWQKGKNAWRQAVSDAGGSISGAASSIAGSISQFPRDVADAIKYNQELDELQVQEEQLEGRTQARLAKADTDTWDLNATTSLGDMTLENAYKLSKNLDAYEEEQAYREQMAELDADGRKGDAQYLALEAEANRLRTDAVNRHGGDMVEVAAEEKLFKDHSRAIKDVKEFFGEEYKDENGVTRVRAANNLGVDGNAKLSSVFTKLSQTAKADERTRPGLVAELNRRIVGAEMAEEAAKGSFADKVGELRQKRYAHAEFHDPTELANRALATMSYTNKHEFGAHIIQAAEEDKLIDVFKIIEPDFTLDSAGFEKMWGKFGQFLSQGELAHLRGKIQAFAQKNKNPSLTALQKRTSTGRIDVLKGAKQLAAAQKNFEKINIQTLLREGKVNNFGTSVAGRFKFNPAFIARIKSNPSSVNRFFENRENMARITPDMIREFRKLLLPKPGKTPPIVVSNDARENLEKYGK